VGVGGGEIGPGSGVVINDLVDAINLEGRSGGQLCEQSGKRRRILRRDCFERCDRDGMVHIGNLLPAR
jgi:hypothetical protein